MDKFILASTLNEAMEYGAKHRIEEYTYLNSILHLFGQNSRTAIVFKTPGAVKHGNYNAITAYCNVHEIKIKELE